MKKIIAVLFVAVTLGCGTNYGPNIPVILTDQQFENYYLDMIRRMNLWFCGVRELGRQCELMPDNIPSLEYMREIVYVEESPKPYGTCYVSYASWREQWIIEVRVGQQERGCMPHELGHIALHEIHHPCASEYEDIGKRYQPGVCGQGM